MIRPIVSLLAFIALFGVGSLESAGAAQTAGSASSRLQDALVPVQLASKPEITVDKILKDIVGKEVSVQDAAGESQPMEWLFEADEPKSAEIVERKASDTSLSLVVQMSTSGAPDTDDANVQLSGRLLLQYEWNGREWILKGIRNMTFRYTRRMMI